MQSNRSQIQILFSSLKLHSTPKELRDLHVRSESRSLFAFSADWLLILLAIYAAAKSIYLLPFSLLLIGSRQRALSNLVHDASHGNLSHSKLANDLIANLLGALPMFDTVSSYRKDHIFHHRYLADEDLDPDSKTHLRYGYDDRLEKQSSPRAFRRILLNLDAWKDSLVGNFLNLSPAEKLAVLTWWTTAATLAFVFGGISLAILTMSVWLVSRGTSYHLIRLAAEFLDHTGLPATDTIAFTRNLPHDGVLSLILHPHEDTYHLIHHIFMGIPHFRLKEAHSVLLRSQVYKDAHHCDSYLLGNHSAWSCWLGQCKREAK